MGYIRENYIETALINLFYSEVEELSIGYGYNKERIHLMMDLINLLDFINYSENSGLDAKQMIKYTRYYEQLLSK